MRGRAGVAALVGASAIVASVSAVQPAFAATPQASAVRACHTQGIQVWSSQVIGPITIPGGVVEHEIWYNCRDGRRISKDEGSFETAFRNVCNWRLDFRYYTTHGRLYKKSKGRTHSGCAPQGSRSLKNLRLKSGKACVLLYVSGRRIATQCHYISRR